MTAAIAVCPDCPTARDRARASLGACVYVCTCGREHRARVVRVYRVDPDAPPPEHAPLDRAAATATALRAEDPELARVRVVLADLRPDHPDPYEPLREREAQDAQTIAVHDPVGAWGGIPRGLASPMSGMLARAELATRSASDVLAEIDAHGGEARPVLLWLRRAASLGQGLRGLYVDAGEAFASSAQAKAWVAGLTAKREGAAPHGRRLVLPTVRAWESVMGARKVAR